VTRWQASLVLLLALVQTLCVIYWTLAANLSAAVYPVHSDSVGIPLFESIINAALLFCLSQGANALLRSPVASMSVYRKVACALLTFLAVCFVTLLLLYWAHPSHYAIACSYGLFLATMVVVGFVRWRER
jgi:hypothetical protein